MKKSPRIGSKLRTNRVEVPRFDRYHDSTALEISFQKNHKIPCNITQHTYQHVNTLIHTQNMPKNCSNLPLKCHILPMKNALSLEEFEKARSLCTALRKAGHKKRRENAKNYRNLTGFFVDSFARFTISWYEGIAIERDRICCPLMFGFESHDSTGASHGSTAARTEPRCEGARSGRREHLPFCRWAARRALRLETRIDLTRAVESWYRAVESWVRFKVFFR